MSASATCLNVVASVSTVCKRLGTRRQSPALKSPTPSERWHSTSASNLSACCWRNRRYSSRWKTLKDSSRTVDISQEQFKAGLIGEGDFLKIKLQLLQFQTDVSSARLAKVQALVGLRGFLGYDAVPAEIDVIGDLAYQPLKARVEDLQVQALGNVRTIALQFWGLQRLRARSRWRKPTVKLM